MAEAWIGRGNVYLLRNQSDEAFADIDQALAIKPDHPDAVFNKSLLKLSLGEYGKGWRLYELRWRMSTFTSPNRYFNQPPWLNDADLTGKALLIHFEQGLGDSIHFFRYLPLVMPLVTGRDHRIVLEVQKPLAPLFRNQVAGLEVIASGDDLPDFDFHCPLMCLPLAFHTTVDTIPAQIPYLHADPEKAGAWRDRIRAMAKDRRPKIGLAWSGNPKFRKDLRRSIPLETLSSIFSAAATWFSLQKDLRDQDRAHLAGNPSLHDLAELLADFSDTAAAVAELDLIISVDTAVAHLAGTMGKPVWVLLPIHPDFRWLRDRADSPWYPTATLFRQSKDGDWTDVLDAVAQAIERLAVKS